MTRNLGSFEYQDCDWKLFQSRELVHIWAKKYSDLFDEQDVCRAINQGGLSKSGKPYHQHFFEWQAAVTLYERFRYLSVYEKYAFRSHKRKWAIVSRMLSSEVLDLLEASVRTVQAPDLFVYTPDEKDWFFCEVKGPKDKLRVEQLAYFDQLSKLTERDVEVIHFTKGRQPPTPSSLG
jgi:hypothetical protein